MQASSTWTPPAGTLGGILEQARARVAVLRQRAAALERQAAAAPPAAPLIEALRGRNVAIIAEVKRRSPSKGWIRPELCAPEQALAYQRGGAAAISVLTEPVHFGGSVEDLVSVREAVEIPVLKKDFHVDPVQMVEARALGASAALLIARALPPLELRQMIDEARRLSLEVLVEVRDERELERALELGTQLVGINNRNLETLKIDPSTSERLLQRVPENIIAVAESGVSTRTDIDRLARAGANAVLVGSTVSAADDPSDAVKQLAGMQRSPRAH
ncbi:MAG TPA: indole-3-glycerol phosphate synthase TrpC [Gemmatimonadaceae bacterium]|nr:indole-3-glycerol phosphate synthase TrpC [Gemmatimonadaceae bacterium]